MDKSCKIERDARAQMCPKLECFVRIVMLFTRGNQIIKYALIVMEQIQKNF